MPVASTSNPQQPISYYSQRAAHPVTNTGRIFGSRLVKKRKCVQSSENIHICRSPSSRTLRAFDFELDIPDIDCSLRTVQEDQGAIFQVSSLPEYVPFMLHSCVCH